MRLSDRLIRPAQAPAAVRKLSSSQVPLLRSSGWAELDDSSEEEFDTMALRARAKEPQQDEGSRGKVGDLQLLERVVKKDDNLNKMALQYGCKVADLKRVNNFIREQDFYALKSIKIPVKINGLLTETRDELLPLQPTALLPADPAVCSERDPRGFGNEQIDQYFRRIDQSIENVSEMEIPSGRDHGIETLNQSAPGHRASGDGADCGIQWWNAVFVMLLVGIVLPVFYLVYFKTQQLDVVTSTSNTTGPINSSLTSSVMRILDHLGQKENVPIARVPRPGSFVPSGG